MAEDDPPRTPEPPTQTLIMDQNKRQLARLDGTFWPPLGAVIELMPPESAVVRNVRLRLSPTLALVIVDVDVGSSVPTD